MIRQPAVLSVNLPPKADYARNPIGVGVGVGIGVEQKMKRQLDRDGSLSFH
jgi:hypothetical protein